MASGLQPICSIKRLAPIASSARWASGGSSELARVEADSSPSMFGQDLPDDAVVEADAGDAHDAPLWPFTQPPSTSEGLALLSTSIVHVAAMSSKLLVSPARPFFARPFFSRRAGVAGGSSAACSSCRNAAHAKRRHREDATCA
mmetsp:Transcript_42859/g.74520  ORF Transcript_42859/g.74520 Transcript_42859/m.74520 type:complete len:144 (+) Transcript_42859:176-607(+)